MKKYRQKHLKHRIKNLKPQKSFFKKSWFLIVLLIIFFVGIGIYITFFLSTIQIQTIQVTGNEKIKTEDLQNSVWKNLGLKNIFIVNTNILKKNLLAGFSQIEDVKIKKEWFNGLRLLVIEKKPVAIFCQNISAQNCFFIDQRGVIFESANPTKTDHFIIHTTLEKENMISQTVVSKDMMEAIITIRQNLKENFDVDITEALVADPLIITTKEGWRIYFDPNNAIDTQIVRMNALLRNEITPTLRKKLQYIYLQYQDRAYYK